jgi:hypothetical protein
MLTFAVPLRVQRWTLKNLALILSATSVFAAGYKGIKVGQPISALPSSELNCSVVFCEGTYNGDFWRIGTLGGKVLNFDVIYVGASLDESSRVSKSITLSRAIRIHSLQPDLVAPNFGLAKDKQNRTYGIVDRANAIVYKVIGMATDPASAVTEVSYLSSDAPVLQARTIPETATLVRAAHAEEARDETPLASAHDSPKVPPTAATPANSGPFGFEHGMTREQVVTLVGRDAVKHFKGDLDDIVTLVTAPKPHPDFEEYMLMISPERGLVKILVSG